MNLALSKLDVKAPGVALTGDGALTLNVSSEVQGAVNVVSGRMASDFSGLKGKYLDLLTKRPGVPIVLEGAFFSKGQALEADVEATVATMAATLNAKISEKGTLVAGLEMPRFAVDGLRGLLPPLAAGLGKQVFLALSAQARGNVNRPDSLAVDLKSLKLWGPKTEVQLTAAFENPERPKPTARLQGPSLNVDGLLPPASPADNSDQSKVPSKANPNQAPAEGPASGAPLATTTSWPKPRAR